MKIKTAEAAVGRWYGILAGLGMDENYLRNKHGPCPLCGGKDRFRFDDKDGRGTWFCNACGAGDGMKLASLITGLEFKDLAAKIDSLLGTVKPCEPKPQADPAKRLRKIYQGLKTAEGINPVTRYLKGRGLSLPEMGIQYHPELEYYDDGKRIGTYPAMVSMFRNTAGKPITYHVTHLTERGTKAEVSSAKKILTPIEPLNGGCVVLFQASEVMGIAEGIETALAAHKIFGFPVWAAATAGLMEQWEPPVIAKKVFVYADNDKNYRGHVAAYMLAHKLVLRGIAAEVVIPSRPGDWNDMLIEQRAG